MYYLILPKWFEYKNVECICCCCGHNERVIYGVVWRTEIGGLNEIQAVGEDVLYYYNVNLGISMKNVMASIIILSTLGAVLDMSLTVTVSVYEVKNHKPDITITEMIKSGMHIGSEVIGTTVNTLLFAYLGESLLLFSYLKMQKYSMELLLNVFRSDCVCACDANFRNITC